MTILKGKLKCRTFKPADALKHYKMKGKHMLSMYVYLQTLCSRIMERDEEGQGLAEYGLILALVAVVAITALSGLGSAIVTKLGQVTQAL